MKLTDKEILNYNKLIAEFMGGVMLVENYHGINIIKFPNETTKDLSGLNYHLSFDWLMPVVEKITKLKYIDEFNTTYDSVANGHYVSITPALRDTFNIIQTEVCDAQINAIYYGVIRFIEWYNQNIE